MTKNVTAKVWSALYSWSDGSLSSAPQAPPPSSGVPFPRTALLAIGGDQSYGYSTTPYLSQVTGHQIGSTGYFPDSTYQNPVSWMGRFDAVLIGGNYEGWSTSSGMDRADLVEAIKQILYPSFVPTVVAQYSIFETTGGSTAPNPAWYTEVANETWSLYSSANSSGSKVVSGAGYEVNWAVAWPNAVGSVAADNYFVVNRVTAPDSTVEGPCEWNADYHLTRVITKIASYTGTVSGTIPAAAYIDPRQSGWNNGGACNDHDRAPNLDGVYTDNNFAAPRYAGYYDLTNNYPANNYGSVACPWLVRGVHHWHARAQVDYARAYPGRTYYNFCNFASWDFSFANGDFSTMSAGLTNYMHGGVQEGAFGYSWSLIAAQGGGWLKTLQAYNALMDFCLAPKILWFGGYANWNADSSPTPPANGNTSYQQMRHILATALMDNGYCFVDDGGNYEAQGSIWWDEFGGNPGTNIPKGWLGYPLSPNRPGAAGVNGVWIRDFTNGVVLCNPAGNGAQTITLAQINAYLGKSYTLSFINGLQNPSVNSGGTFSSFTLQDNGATSYGDGLLLVK